MIKQNVQRILSELPAGVQLVAVAKGRTPEEIREAIEGGVEIIGQNYVQEAEKAYSLIGNRVKWHFIGHLQRNKVKKAVTIFDMIETVDSLEIGQEIDRRCAQIGKIMPVLIEVNSGREKQKTGVFPEDVSQLVKEIAELANIRVVGLMTIGPHFNHAEEVRPYYVVTRKLFGQVKQLNLPNVEMKYLSMGMSNSYQLAIAEGANIVRIGTRIFGEQNEEEVVKGEG
ncbi:MAG: alanine racemase domain protein [Dehalococcoidales bacterium]|nr:alanine racemase domain protein [Dehalococcoidales bacterium]